MLATELATERDIALEDLWDKALEALLARMWATMLLEIWLAGV